MADLDDLTDQNVDLEELSREDSQTSQRVPTTNPASNANLAAYVAASSAQGAEEVEPLYRQTLDQMDGGATPEVVQSMLDLARKGDRGKAMRALSDFLADPEYPDDMKQGALDQLMSVKDEDFNVVDAVSYAALEEESADDENAESENVRVSLANIIPEMNSYKKEMQAVFNSEVAKSDVNVAKAFGDIFEYFVPFVESKFAGGIVDGLREGDVGAYGEALTLLGNLKMDTKELVSNIHPDDRVAFSRTLAQMINQHSGIVYTNQNDFARVDMLRTFFEDGYYTDVDKWIDNAVSVLDLTILGGPAGRLVKRGKNLFGRGAPVASVTEARDAMRQAVANRVQPTSLSQNYKDTNPEKARALHEAMAADESGEVAQAAYGSSREDALLNDLAPDVGTDSGRIRSKVNKPGKKKIIEPVTPDEIKEFARTTGAIHLTEGEKEFARAKVMHDFEHVNGMTPRKEMFQVKTEADGVTIRGIYGPSKSGFSDPVEAIESAKWMLRDYAVKDSDIKLLVREGSDYVPTTLKEVRGRDELTKLAKDINRASGKKARKIQEQARKAGVFRQRQNDFLVQVDHRYRMEVGDVADSLEDLKVYNNFFDRHVPMFRGTSGEGSLQQMFVPPESYLPKEVIDAAFVSVDRSAELERKVLDLATNFSDPLAKMPNDRQAAVTELMKIANDEGRTFSPTDLRAVGLDDNEIQVMKDWREYWDTIYWLENRDAAKSLSAQGFQEFVDVTTDSKLFVKPMMNRNSVPRDVRVLDYDTDSVRPVTKDELDELYERGGYVAKTRSPVVTEDDVADWVLVQNVAGTNYTRKINDSTEVLNYREGYFGVHYTDPYFIDEVVMRGDEEIVRRAVATSDLQEKARLKRDRMQKLIDPEVEASKGLKTVYNIRRDKRSGTFGTDEDQYWSVNQFGGRTSQRVRGRRLESSNSNVDDLSNAPIMSPVDSMLIAAKSIARRASLRDVIETTKQRVLKHYPEYMPKHPVTKQPAFPSNIKDVKYYGKGDELDRNRLGDAQSLVNYINSLEHGYVNTIDNSYKAAMMRIADLGAKIKFEPLEKFANVASTKRGPVAMGKAMVFTTTLALNPFAQALVQSHQAVMLTANFPKWVASGRPVNEVIAMTTMGMGAEPAKATLKALGMTMDEAKQMYKQWRNSGLSAAIDKHSLVRESLADLADQATRKEIGLIKFSRKIGFDFGENVNIMTSWLAHRDRAIRNGEDLTDQAVLDRITAGARNFTYGMNAAGELAYTQNSLGLIMQFQQVIHKAINQFTANRSLSRNQKLGIFGTAALLFTFEPEMMVDIFGDNLPQDGFARDLALHGLEGAFFNAVLSGATGEETSIDWSRMAPYGMYGSMELIHSLFTSSAGEIVANTPAGSLFFGNNPRFDNLYRSAAGYFNQTFDSDPNLTKVEFSTVVTDFLSLSSGFSNAFKARLYMDAKKKMSTLGGTTDPNISTAEAWFTALGFQTEDEVLYWYARSKMYNKSKEARDDFDKWYDQMAKDLTKKGITPEDIEYRKRVWSTAWRVWGNDNQFVKDQLERRLSRDVSDGRLDLYNQVLRAGDIMSLQDRKIIINNTPDIPEEQRQQIIEQLEATQRAGE